jgi:chromate transporter
MGLTPIPKPSFRDAFWVWCRVALTSFGGPAGQVAVMHRILVDEQRWLSEARFLHALSYCTLLPGPEAQQLATYTGWLLHGTRGGVMAGMLFVLPGFLAILALSMLYVTFGQTGWVAAALYGLKPAVLAVVIEAVGRIGRRALTSRLQLGLAAAAFLGIFFFGVPFPAIVAGAGVAGWMLGATSGPGRSDGGEGIVRDERPTLARTLGTAGIWLLVWSIPIVLLLVTVGPRHVLVQQAIFFSKAAVVTFGGAYAVLAYVAQQAVETYGWLRPGEMLDGLGMAETTPGPLIQVVQFVAFLGAFRAPEPLAPMTAALLASIVTTWVTYAPCFLWIFVGAPYVEALRASRIVARTLAGIMAAVVGVILNLSVWFGLHVVFRHVDEVRLGWLRLWVPQLTSLDLGAAAIALLAAVATFRWHWSVGGTLLLSMTLGVCLRLVLPA